MRSSFLILITAFISMIATAQSTVRLKYKTTADFPLSGIKPVDSTIYYYSGTSTLKDSSQVIFNWNNTTQQYNNQRKVISEYNAQGNVSRQTTLVWDGSGWKNNTKTEITYNANEERTQSSNYYWFANNWFENSRYNWLYNANGKVAESVYMDTVNGLLENRSKSLYSYDGLQRNASTKRQQWDNINNMWYDNDITENFFTGNTERIDSVRGFTRNSQTGNLTNPWFRQYILYGIGNMMVEQQGYSFDYQLSGFTKNYRTQFSWDNNGNRIGYISQTGVNNVWVNNSKSDEQYDNLNRKTEQILQQFNTQQNSWINSFRYSYTYANDSSLVTEQTALWSNQNWNNYYLTKWFFEPLGNPSSVYNDYIRTPEAYPNPFISNTIIEFETPLNTEVQVQITDLNGRVVYQQKTFTISGNNHILWDGTDNKGNALPGGIYIVQFTEKTFNQTFKLIKQ